jgi:outer membrane protein assembly factor BamB
MRGLMKLLVLLIVSSIFVGCASEQPTITAAQRAAKHAKSVEDAGLRYYWKSSDIRELLPSGEKIARTYLLDENFYCLTNMNRLIAVNASSGTMRWNQWAHIAKPGVKVFDPVHVTNVSISREPMTRQEILQPKRFGNKGEDIDLVIISTRSNALVIDRDSGQIIRDIKFNFAAGATAGVAANGRFMFVPDTRGWYHAIGISNMLESWTLSVDAAIKVAPRYVADKIVVASQDGHLQVASTVETRKVHWGRDLAAPIEAPILATRTHLMVPCMDRRLHAFDTATGQRAWEAFDCKRPLKNIPQISEVSVFQYARGGKFYALDLVSGKLRWDSNNARKVLAAIKSNVYLQDNNNRILVVDEILGDVKSSIQMPPGDLLTPNTSASAIYGATRGGNLYCLRRIDAGHITAEMLQKKKK